MLVSFQCFFFPYTFFPYTGYEVSEHEDALKTLSIGLFMNRTVTSKLILVQHIGLCMLQWWLCFMAI